MQHFKINMGVAWRCLLMALFHIAHAFIPCKYTSHMHWGFDFKKLKNRETSRKHLPVVGHNA